MSDATSSVQNLKEVYWAMADYAAAVTTALMMLRHQYGPRDAMRWISEPQVLLNGRVPADLLETIEGRREVEALISGVCEGGALVTSPSKQKAKHIPQQRDYASALDEIANLPEPGYDSSNARIMRRIATNALSMPPPPRREKPAGFRLNGYQLKAALKFIVPDEEAEPLDEADLLETEITILWSENGHSGTGFYCCVTEYPEEGSILLPAKPESPPEPKALHT